MKSATLFLITLSIFFFRCKKDSPTNNSGCGRVTDIDGNTYDVVQIGSQCWMQENLKTTRYRNGSTILAANDSVSWADINNVAYPQLPEAAWCYYGSNASNNNIYGKLYNWTAVADSQGICPYGWHVPNDSDWEQLVDYLGGISIAGGAMKATTLWQSPNTGATNSSGFTALPGGSRSNYNSFSGMGTHGIFWSSTRHDAYINPRRLYHDKSVVDGPAWSWSFGLSCRCVMD